MQTAGAGQLVHRYAQQARVPDLSPHYLRHRFGYRMAEIVPLHRLAQIVRHDSLDTPRVYTQATPGDLPREVGQSLGLDGAGRDPLPLVTASLCRGLVYSSALF